MSIAATLLIYNRISMAYLENKTKMSAQQTSQVLEQNIRDVTQNVSQCSDYIYFDESIQSALRKSRTSTIDPSIQSVINNRLTDMILLNSYISSIYLFDNYGNVYCEGKLYPPAVVNKNMKKAPWYSAVEKSNGSSVWIADDGSVIERNGSYLPVSLARIIYDVDTYKPVGVLMINLNKSFLEDVLQKINSQYKSQFFVIDGKGNYITKTTDSGNREVVDFMKTSAAKASDCRSGRLNGKVVILSSTKSKSLGWQIIGIVPLSEYDGQFESAGTVAVIVILLDIFLFFIGQIYITKLITKPLTKMKKYMVHVQNGQFEPIPVEPVRDDEIVRLKKVYNIMVDQIQNLIRKEKEEQIQIRLNELNLIRAQINPHFLYNTLDAVSALALIQDCNGAYTLTQALENFYRISLSSGKDVVSVGEEIKCIQDYVTILNIRYNGSFDMEYEISDEMRDLKILKLILQPFVENSILHGVHNKHGRGRIVLKAFMKNGTMQFEIEDNGVGIPEEKIAEIMGEKKMNQKGGFGIYSSITRISLFYGVESPVTIQSQVNKGTIVTVKVPVIGREENDE